MELPIRISATVKKLRIACKQNRM